MLKSDKVLKKHKVLIFTEFMDTARYLRRELDNAGIEGVDEVDSVDKRDRSDVIVRFAPLLQRAVERRTCRGGYARYPRTYFYRCFVRRA